MRTPHRSLRWLAPALVAGLTITACGGSDGDEPDDEPAASAETAADDTTGSGDTDTPDDPADAGTEDAVDETTDAPVDDTADDTDDDASGDHEPGPVSFRAVNLLDRPVDLHVRTTGLVEAFPVMADLAAGEVSEFAAPPADGNFVVTEAGQGDPECVVDCDGVIATISGLGLDEDSALCLSETVVDAVGAENLLVDGELIDPTALPTDLQGPFAEAITTATVDCGLDPGLFD